MIYRIESYSVWVISQKKIFLVIKNISLDTLPAVSG